MQGKKLFVGNLNYSITNSELEELFAEYGQVDSVNVISGKGFGFVEMSSPSDAAAAKEALDGKDFKGRTMKIDEARPQQRKPERRGPRNY